MDIVFPEHYGWCPGVKRAVETTFKTLKKKDIPTYALSEIVHSRDIMDRIKGMGLNLVDDISQIKDRCNLIIGAFGIPSHILSKIDKSKISVVDTTCPYVREVFKIGEKLKKDGYYTVIVGNKFHIEVQNILSYTGSKSVVINNRLQLRNISLPRKVGVISQTTQTPEIFKEVVCEIIERTKEARIYRTICQETLRRQNSSKEIAENVDIMLVVGSKHSENTKNLYHLCKKINPNTYHIEDESEISHKMLKKVKKVGITSGASTPQWIIEKVIEKLKKYEI